MELLAVRTARVIAHFPTEELNPHGRAIIPDVYKALAERYSFLKYPEKYPEYVDENGVGFAQGKWGETSIDEMKIHVNGIVVATGSSTDDSEALLREVITWAVESFGLTFREDLLNELIYVSELVVRFERPPASLHPVLRKLATRLSEGARNFGGYKFPFDFAGIMFDADPLQSRYSLTQFRIERLSDAPFTSDKYFSCAPLPTNEHIRLLEEFEAALKG
jgi:hypothetical protein